jgi:hypothetical protein
MTERNRVIALFYLLKPLIPRRVQIQLRRRLVARQRRASSRTWPIDPAAAHVENWSGWPEQKKFAVILTHDVDTPKGYDRCTQLAELEQHLGFRSSFYFVPKRYNVAPELRECLVNGGFEVGVHGLYHDGRLYESREMFRERVEHINQYLKEWQAVGFRSPSMHHNLEWLHDLEVEYDASTFDTDPFEPQSDASGQSSPSGSMGGQPGGDTWNCRTRCPGFHPLCPDAEQDDRHLETETRLDRESGRDGAGPHASGLHVFWQVGGKTRRISIRLYEDLLRYIKDQYRDEYWHALPKDVARFWTRCVVKHE